jgi:ATP-binding cassette subfamily C protein CydD
MKPASSLQDRGAAAFKLDRRLIGLAAASKADLYVTIACSALAGGLVVSFAWQLTIIIEGVFLRGASLQEVLLPLTTAVVIAILRSINLWCVEIFSNRLATAVKQSLRHQLTAKLIQLGPGFLPRQRKGEVSNTLVNGVEQIEAYFTQFLPQAVLAGLLPITLLAFIAPQDPLSALILLLTAPLIPLFMILIGNAADRLTRRQWQKLSRMSAVFYDLLQGLRTLRALGRSRGQVQLLDHASQVYNQATLRVLRLAFTSALTLEWLSTLSTAIIAVEVGLRLLSGGMEFQAALFILVLAPEFYLPLRTLGVRFHAAMEGLAASERIFALLDTPPVSITGFKPPPSAPPVIKVEGISFSHEGRSQPTLQGVNLLLRPGETFALLGPTGSGKSSLIKLLLRFHSPHQGAVWVNETRLDEIDTALWNPYIAWVPQQPYIFNDSLRMNLLRANRNVSQKEITDALNFAGLGEVYSGWPDGLDTELGSDGARLSAGEARRVALARAYLRDAPLVLMDEPTAHLDPELEQSLMARLDPWLQTRTALIATHRLSLTSICSHVAVLSAGRIIQHGARETLAESDGPYRELLISYGGTA